MTTSAGIEPTTSGFDRPLLFRLSYEATQQQTVGDNGGIKSNVKVEGTNEYRNLIAISNFRFSLTRKTTILR